MAEIKAGALNTFVLLTFVLIHTAKIVPDRAKECANINVSVGVFPIVASSFNAIGMNPNEGQT